MENSESGITTVATDAVPPLICAKRSRLPGPDNGNKEEIPIKKLKLLAHNFIRYRPHTSFGNERPKKRSNF